MKFGKYDISLKNIQAFIQGNYRVLVEKYGGEFIKLEPHIQEQVLYRTSLANPECLAKGMCKCNCEIPALFYTDLKLCSDACYPPMMNVETWNDFKLNIPISSYTTQMDNENLSNQNDNLLRGVNQHLGNFERSIKTITNKFNIKNTLPQKAKILKTTTSCGCSELKVLIDEADPNEDFVIEYTIDIENKLIGSFDLIITVQYILLDKTYQSIDYVISLNLIN